MDREPTAHEKPSQNKFRWAGAVAAPFGLYLALIGLGVLPVPGGPRNLHAPLWIVLVAGIAFFLAGWATLLQTFGRADNAGELPSGAPRMLHVAHYLTGVAIFACFALAASWAAFSDGPIKLSRGFSSPAISNDVPGGRIAFGIGAALAWASTFAYAIVGWRKLTKRNET